MIDIVSPMIRSGKRNQTDRDAQQGHEIKTNILNCLDQALRIGIAVSTIEAI
jgi:hypothetical protein